MDDSTHPAGVLSFLDTDLYKLTMQNAVLRFFPSVPVTYSFKNRTPQKKLSREAFKWLSEQISKLGNIHLSEEEEGFLRERCPYLSEEYITWLRSFRLRPREQVKPVFTPDEGCREVGDRQVGDVTIHIEGLWVDTILYEIPILALTSEAFFKFEDTAWTYEGQEEKAYHKAKTLLEGGCLVSEFGTRRRRDYHTQALVFRGLLRADADFRKSNPNAEGKIQGTSNVHLAMRFKVDPIGTVAHEWFMGVAAVTDSYEDASERALEYWVRSFGVGVLGIALTDTFGTPIFLRAFNKEIPDEVLDEKKYTGPRPITYASAFRGVRQDSGDPATFVARMREFYDQAGIKDKKTIVFSDSLNIDTCLEYRALALKEGFQPSFGVGTFFTNDFVNTETGGKSTPLNIVIKLASAKGNQAVKISDDVGKNTGDEATVKSVKQRLGYVETESWTDESKRWGQEGQKPEAIEKSSVYDLDSK